MLAINLPIGLGLPLRLTFIPSGTLWRLIITLTSFVQCYRQVIIVDQEVCRLVDIYNSLLVVCRVPDSTMNTNS